MRELDSDDERRVHPHKAKAPPQRGLCRRLSRLLFAARKAESGEAEAEKYERTWFRHAIPCNRPMAPR